MWQRTPAAFSLLAYHRDQAPLSTSFGSPHISMVLLMTNQSTQGIQLLRAAYVAFNARDIGAALALMTDEVTWPKAFKGGLVRGPDEIREYR